MFSDLGELWKVQSSAASIARYMVACYNYDVHTIIVGEKPYPDHMVPFIGSSYSQCIDTPDTPTIVALTSHPWSSPISLGSNFTLTGWMPPVHRHGCLMINA